MITPFKVPAAIKLYPSICNKSMQFTWVQAAGFWRSKETDSRAVLDTEADRSTNAVHALRYSRLNSECLTVTFQEMYWSVAGTQ